MQARPSPKLELTRWSPALEEEVRRLWEDEGLYEFRPGKGRIFAIDTPPPYVAVGVSWHPGAVTQYSQIDMIARAARMMGYNVLFPVGMDRNGMPVETYVERAYRIRMKDVPREKFIELCRRALDEAEPYYLKVLRMIGFSADFQGLFYRTDSPEYRALTQATFIELWRRGLIYEADRPNNYCVECGTTLADADVEYEERPAKLVYMRFPLKEGGHIVVASTRPELLAACRIVLFNPKDERHRHLEGKRAVVPLYGHEVEIRAHPAAKPEFGSGLMMVCSFGDYTDVLLFRELGLSPVYLIDAKGRMTKESGFLEGLSVEQARERVIEELRRANLLDAIQEIQHRTPICDRSRTPIEIIALPEFYLKQLDFLDQVSRASARVRFHPAKARGLLRNWIRAVSSDWPISRRRYYGTEVPIWYCVNCKAPQLPEPGKYYRPWRERPPFERCGRCGGTEFRGDERTFDTWMDSSISALYITGYGRDEELFSSAYPAAIRPQGKDIVRTWLYYSLLRCLQLTGRPPWRRAWIGGMGLDARGRPMHRHLGNVIDPMPLLEKYGADCFRFWGAQEAGPGEDFRIAEERIAAAQRFLTKLLNVSRFISSFPRPRRARLQPSDLWILAELSSLTRRCRRAYASFNFHAVANSVRDFIWNLFAPHYIEMVKARAYGEGFGPEEQRAAWYTLHTCLRALLLLLAPIVPHISDYLWRQLYDKGSVHRKRLPRPLWSTEYAAYTEKITSFNARVWALKKQRGLSLTSPIELELDADLEPFAKDLIAMHRLLPRGSPRAEGGA